MFEARIAKLLRAHLAKWSSKPALRGVYPRRNAFIERRRGVSLLAGKLRAHPHEFRLQLQFALLQKNDGGVPAPVSSKPCLSDTAFVTRKETSTE